MRSAEDIVRYLESYAESVEDRGGIAQAFVLREAAKWASSDPFVPKMRAKRSKRSVDECYCKGKHRCKMHMDQILAGTFTP